MVQKYCEVCHQESEDFLRFPENIEKGRKWAASLLWTKEYEKKLKEKKSNNIYICRRHFSADDFMENNRRRRRKDTIPKLIVELPSSSSNGLHEQIDGTLVVSHGPNLIQASSIESGSISTVPQQPAHACYEPSVTFESPRLIWQCNQNYSHWPEPNETFSNTNFGTTPFSLATTNFQSNHSSFNSVLQSLDSLSEDFWMLSASSSYSQPPVMPLESQKNMKDSFYISMVKSENMDGPLSVFSSPPPSYNTGSEVQNKNFQNEVRRWIPSRRFPYNEQINTVLSSRDDLLVFAKAQLFHTQFENTRSSVLTVKTPPYKIADIRFVRHIPKSTFFVYVASECTKEFVIFDFMTASTLQRTSVEGNIEAIECSESVVVVCLETRSLTQAKPYAPIVTFGLGLENGVECRKMNEYRSHPIFYNRSLSLNGILAFNGVGLRLNVYNANGNKLLGIGRKHTRFLINADGSLVVAFEFQLSLLSFYDTANMNKKPATVVIDIVPTGFTDICAISDDNCCILVCEWDSYKIITVDYSESGKPTLAFVFSFKSEAHFRSFVFIRIDGIQHLQFVTKQNVLMQYKIQEANKTWLKEWR